eukprot:TRINITY_DN369_c0_g1_i1.p2 TRINITY_DN369_c0_g1~~TRINITY_DN369_c0_g1_i1.p2  ORF type:complete len:402 (+),score=45.38 TRINITY_DN369_c0_g1_i1:29-1234(+)
MTTENSVVEPESTTESNSMQYWTRCDGAAFQRIPLATLKEWWPSPVAWLEGFQKACADGIPKPIHQARIKIWKGTKQAIDNDFYRITNEKWIKLNLAEAPQSHVEKFDLPPKLPPQDTAYKTVVSVVESDMLEYHHKLQDEGYNPAVLNMACAGNPGGGYLGGSGAQEENCFRRSDYVKKLPKALYPLGSSVIYSSNVVVFRGSEAKGYPLMEAPRLVGFIACAAMSRPTTFTDKNKRLRLVDRIADELYGRILTMLTVCSSFGHDSLVLSALGCGAYKNPPEHVAELFQKALMEPSLQGRYKRVVFAILNDHNTRKKHNPEGNIAPFKRVFKDWLDCEAEEGEVDVVKTPAADENETKATATTTTTTTAETDAGEPGEAAAGGSGGVSEAPDDASAAQKD